MVRCRDLEGIRDHPDWHGGDSSQRASGWRVLVRVTFASPAPRIGDSQQRRASL